MHLCCLIFLVVTVALWFLACEYPVLFGIYRPTCVVRHPYFNLIVSVVLLVSVSFSSVADVENSLLSHFSFERIDCRSMILVLLSALIVLSALRYFSLKGSAVYALLGAMQAYDISKGGAASGLSGYAGALVVAPVMAFLLAAALRLLCRDTICRSHIHLITLSYYMRFVVIVGLVLTALATGLNWGGLLFAGAAMSSQAVSPSFAVIVVLAILMLPCVFSKHGDATDGPFADFSIWAVVSIGFSVVAVLLFFSFDATAGLLGMRPVPLATGSLVFAAISGVEVAQKSHLVERDDYIKEVAALVIAPLGTFLLTYVIMHISGLGEDGSLVDFTVMAAAVLVVLGLSFAAYTARQRRKREATERLVVSQQQQIYEHSRALNDMELKVVISENQALHNAVEQKRQEVMNVALSIVEQREYLESLNDIVRRLTKSEDEKEKAQLTAELGRSLKQRLSYDRDVDSQYFYAQAESLHEDFNAKLSENFPDLTQQERRLATLLRLGFSSKYIATLMNITPKSVEISRYRLRQKLGLSKGDNLVNFIKSI